MTNDEIIIDLMEQLSRKEAIIKGAMELLAIRDAKIAVLEDEVAYLEEERDHLQRDFDEAYHQSFRKGDPQ